MSKLKSLALKLPYPLLNYGRLIRGEIRKRNSCIAVKGANYSFGDAIEGLKRGYLSEQTIIERFAEGCLGPEGGMLRWAAAFNSYRSIEKSKRKIDLLWADGPAPGNFGDWLSPYVIGKLAGRGVELVDDYKPPSHKHIVAIGSLAPAINRWAHVLGAGAASVNSNMNPLAEYHSVRGPYTARVLKKSGGKSVNQFGDLGYVISKLYTPKFRKIDAEVLLVRHMNHASQPIVLAEGVAELSIEAASPEDIENFIDTIFSVGKVVTSAMHCFIVCQSYGIPCALVNFDSNPHAVYGDGIKYLDAMAGVGLPAKSPILIPFDFDYRRSDSIIYEGNIGSAIIEEVKNHAQVVIEKYLEE